MDYVNIYYNGNLSISLYNGNYFQVVEENNLKSFYYIEKYDNNNEYYSDMSIIWQSTTNTSVGGYDTWQTISSSGGYNIQTLEVQENKVTTLSSGSTNTEYPSAAAVYTYGESIKATIPSADWDETNSSSKNYIQNKPFYKETITLYYIVEIIDPETLQPVPEGEVGELVLTTINREGMPLLRYRTRDLTRILPGECPCGRHHKRLDRMKGRSDDMIILKGVNIFPIQIETVLMQFKELSSNYLITLETKDSNDEMMIEVELEKLFTDDYARLQVLTKNITRVLKDEILVTPYVKLVPKGTLPQSEGKAVRVKDLRKPF